MGRSGGTEPFFSFQKICEGKFFEMVSWGGLGGLAPPGNSVTRALPPGGGLGGFAPQESPLITRALPPQRPCLAPVPCPPFFSSEFVRPNFFARMARILMIFGPFESHRRQRKFEKISNERKIIESIESIDSIERSRDRSYRSEAAVLMVSRHLGVEASKVDASTP